MILPRKTQASFQNFSNTELEQRPMKDNRKLHSQLRQKYEHEHVFFKNCFCFDELDETLEICVNRLSNNQALVFGKLKPRKLLRRVVIKKEIPHIYSHSRYSFNITKLKLYLGSCSLRTADVFPVVASLPPLFFGGREATTGNTSAVRRLGIMGMTEPCTGELSDILKSCVLMTRKREKQKLIKVITGTSR